MYDIKYQPLISFSFVEVTSTAYFSNLVSWLSKSFSRSFNCSDGRILDSFLSVYIAVCLAFRASFLKVSDADLAFLSPAWTCSALDVDNFTRMSDPAIWRLISNSDF